MALSSFDPHLPTTGNVLQVQNFHLLNARDMREHGKKNAVTLAVLRSLSNERGFCWASNEYLCSVLDMCLRTLKTHLSELEGLGLIYRSTWNTIKGKRRHIVLPENYNKYLREWLNAHNAPQKSKDKLIAARDRHCNGPPMQDKPLPVMKEELEDVEESDEKAKVQNDANDDPRVQDLHLAKEGQDLHLAINKETPKESIKDNDEYIRPPTPPKGGSSSPSFSSSSLPSDDKTFIEKLHDEIPKSCGAQFLPLAIEYYNLRRETIEARNNPMAAVIHAVKNGYALTDVEETKQKVRLKEREREARENPSRMAPEVARIQQRPETTERYQQSMKSFTEAVSVRLENSKMKLYEIGPKGYKWSAENMRHVEQRSVYDANTVKDLVCLCRNSGNDKALEWIMAQKTPKNRHLYPDW